MNELGNPEGTNPAEQVHHIELVRDSLLAELMNPSTTPERLEEIAAIAARAQVKNEAEAMPDRVWGDYDDKQLSAWLVDPNITTITKDSIAAYVNGRKRPQPTDD